MEPSADMWVVIHGAMVFLTMSAVAGLRKIVPAINGKIAVLAVGTAIGIALSVGIALLTRSTIGVLTIVAGAGYAAAAFGYSSWTAWAKSKIPVPVIPETAVPELLPAASGGPKSCPKCGLDVHVADNRSKFCPYCGSSLEPEPRTERDSDKVKRGGAAARS